MSFCAFGTSAEAQTDCSTQTDMPQVECEFLVEVYNTMGGPGWWPSTSWNSNQSPCSWAGVTCEGGRIVGLSFYEEFLFGTFPASIANLTQLEVLGVQDATVSVPVEFYSLPNIRRLWSYNGGIGALSPQLVNFTKLEALNLTGFFGGLTGKEAPSGRLRALPTYLGQLTGLKSLTLAWQNFNGTIPSNIGNLTNLEHLNLSSNWLDSPLPDLQNLTNLRVLKLGGNQFSENLPSEWVFLSQLEELWLGWNSFTGPVPNGWGNLANLRVLSLNQNDLYGNIPPFWSRLTALEWLNLSFNGFSGAIPAEWGGFPNLEHIYLENNRFTGGVPENLGDGVAFLGRRLRLDNNHLNGEIPDSWANGQFVDLSIKHNCLTTTSLAVVAMLDALDPGWFPTQCLPLFVDGFDAGSANNWDRIVGAVAP